MKRPEDLHIGDDPPGYEEVYLELKRSVACIGVDEGPERSLAELQMSPSELRKLGLRAIEMADWLEDNE